MFSEILLKPVSLCGVQGKYENGRPLTKDYSWPIKSPQNSAQLTLIITQYSLFSALIQLMAASRAGRDLCYFTFDDERLRDQLDTIHKFLTVENMLPIGTV